MATGLDVVDTMTTDTLMMCHEVDRMNDNEAFLMIQRAGVNGTLGEGMAFQGRLRREENFGRLCFLALLDGR